MRLAAYLVVMVVVVAAGCKAERISHDDGLDRSSPSATFQVYQQGMENQNYGQVARSMSAQQKRFLLFERLFSSGFVYGTQKEQLDKLFAKNNFDLEQLNEQAESRQLKGQTMDSDEWFLTIEDSIEDLDQFLIDSARILSTDSKQTICPEILGVSVDGERATVTHNFKIYESTTDSDGKRVEEFSLHELQVYMRKYGDEWLICPEQEWKDPSFIWTVPD